MKRKITGLVVGVSILAMSVLVVNALAKETTTRTTRASQNSSAGMGMMNGNHQQMMQRCPMGMGNKGNMKMMQQCPMMKMGGGMAMMQKMGMKPAMMKRCMAMMQTRVFADSPGALYGQAQKLNLSEKQKARLVAIETKARKEALAVLTAQQKKKLGTIPQKPMVMAQMCQQMRAKMMPMMQKMMNGKGKSGSMMTCPVMKMMGNGNMSQKGPMMHNMMKNSNNANTRAVQTNCPVMGGKINKNIYTEYKGKKVYFCCPSCVEKFKKNPEKYVDKLPQFK